MKHQCQITNRLKADPDINSTYLAIKTKAEKTSVALDYNIINETV